VQSDKVTYEEVGIVVDDGNDPNFSASVYPPFKGPKKGDKIYFDSWMVSKFPTGEAGKYYWLVPFANIKAYEEQVPE
jgi:hypothetical protein